MNIPFTTLSQHFSESNFTPSCHTNHPTVTGTSIIGLSCSDSVLIATDTLGSYGSLSRFTSISRIIEVGKFTIVAVTGDFADFQFISDRLDEKVRQSKLWNDNIEIGPREIYSWLNRVLYYRRTQLNPLWLNLIVAGWDNSVSCDGIPFISYIDMVGTAYEDNCITTGMASYLIKPLLRKALPNLESEHILNSENGRRLVSESMKVLFYRDCRAYPKYHIATVSKEGIIIEEVMDNFGSWTIAEYVHGYD